MKPSSAILIAALAAFALSSWLIIQKAEALTGDDLEAWENFKLKYNKTYESPEEEAGRQRIFLENKRYIEAHNSRAGESFTQGINPLSDLTTEEINRTRNGFRLYNDTLDQVQPQDPQSDLIDRLMRIVNSTLSLQQQLQLNGSTTGNTIYLAPNSSNPLNRGWFEDLFSAAQVDWRASGRVSRVKDQGACGSCWAYSTIGALESILASQGREVLLSEQNLVDCSRKYGNHGCNGGLMVPALRYVRDFGIMKSTDYPYTGKDETCKFKSKQSVMSVRGAMILPRGNEALLRLALSVSGPLPVAIDAGPRSFHHYRAGVYNDPACRNTGSALNHAVLLVGYGTDRLGGDYWLLKNSWGLKWGENGYIKVARNRRNLCGIASYAVLPIV